MNKVSTEQVLNKAYRLAYFLHQDKATAMQIVAAATLKLNVALAVQSKRLYYIPVGRFSRGESRRTDGIRNKALFSDLHLLQRLIYVESEPYERQKEPAQLAPEDVHAAGDPASEEDLLVYFIKHLVRITTKRNAFYVTLGVSRLLHSYSTLETMEIYNAVIGEPERVKDDYYYRSRKAVLMHEMYQRFGQLIRASRQLRGEERFETQQGSSELRSLMRECLRVFTPWDTQCPVPRDFDPLKSVIPSLTSKSSTDENEIEVKRIHAVLHPDCFERLIAAFGYRPPVDQMELPRFFLDQSNDDSPPRQRSAPDDLSTEELAEISHMLDDQARRRRRSSPTSIMRILVDGVERGRLNPAEQSSISFSADEDAEIIEVKTTDSSGELLLATHLVTSSLKDESIVSSIRLEGGQDLSLRITRRQNEVNGETDLLVDFSYRETAPWRVVRLWWQRLKSRGMWSGATISTRHVLAGSLVVIVCVMGYVGYKTLRSGQTQPAPVVAEALNSPTPTVPIVTATQSPPRPKIEKKTAKATAPPEDDVTRSGNVVANLRLKEVKKVYVEIRGVDDTHSLNEILNASGIVTATTNADEADAALKIVVSQNSTSAQLINARGTVLWRGTRGNPSEIVKDMLSTIRMARAH